MNLESGTKPIPVTEGFLDFDAPDYRPLDVSAPRVPAVALMRELLDALEEE